MLKYCSTRQISIEEFKTPFQMGLDPNNRWVHLSRIIPWDELVGIYARSLSIKLGRPTMDARVEIGALILQHILQLSDEELLEQIRENPYLQYFLGYEEYSYRQVFDASLLVMIRRRLGETAVNEMNEIFLSHIEQGEKKRQNSSKKKKQRTTAKSDQPSPSADESKGEGGDEAGPTHGGKLLMDATVAPSDIKYPTDLELLNKAREASERLIDLLWEPEPGKVKPRTYRRKARRVYLSVAKQRKKRKKILGKAIGKQLGYLRRNIATIQRLLNEKTEPGFPLRYRDLRLLWIIQEVYRQQKEMYDEKTKRIADRIVSIHQPYVRPIVRGKAKAEVEFGAKLSVSLVGGYCYLERISWDAFNESGDLVSQVENFKRRFGHYPEAVIADNIYGTRENRAYLKERGIRFSGAALGRPPSLTEENAAELRAEKKRRKQEAKIRGWIEGAFGRGKRGYGLDLIKTKTKPTSETYVAAVFFAMNLVLALKAHFFALWRPGLLNAWSIYKAMQAILQGLWNSTGAASAQTDYPICLAPAQAY